jgi:signal peptidase II
MYFYLISAAIVLLDQLSKLLVVRSMRLGQSISILPGFFDLTFVLNPGAAFSLFATLPDWIRNRFFVLISIAACVLIVVYRSRYLRENRLASASLSLILGGAIGNLVDRLRYGVVVDFFDAHVAEHHWPVFNVADSAISVGVTLLLLEMLLEWWRERKGSR